MSCDLFQHGIQLLTLFISEGRFSHLFEDVSGRVRMRFEIFHDSVEVLHAANMSIAVAFDQALAPSNFNRNVILSCDGRFDAS